MCPHAKTAALFHAITEGLKKNKTEILGNEFPETLVELPILRRHTQTYIQTDRKT